MATLPLGVTDNFGLTPLRVAYPAQIQPKPANLRRPPVRPAGLRYRSSTHGCFTAMSPTESDVTTYYRAALTGLRFLESRRPDGGRFGSDADHRWRAFRGELTAAARIDLLVRDADAEWPGAIGPRTVFGFDAVAEDDPFGPQWPSLEGTDAEELWRGPAPAFDGAKAALDAVAEEWGIALDWPELPPLDPAETLWLAGPSAIAAAALKFTQSTDLDWAAQVTCVATPPAHRQIAALAAAIANATSRAAIASGVSAPEAPPAATVHVSADAAPEDRAAVRKKSE